MNRITHELFLFLKLAIYYFASILPKNKKIWVFGSWFGEHYSDNSRYLFDYVNKHQKNIRAIWISKDKEIVREINDLGYESHYFLSLKGIWLQLNAHLVLVCQSTHSDLFAPSIGKKAKVIQLWHGIPLKNIMYDTFEQETKNKMTPYINNSYDYLIATSPVTQKVLAKAFRMPLEKTLLTGFPRNDAFFPPIQRIKNKKFKCIYMPTFRGEIGEECDLFVKYGFNFEAIDTLLASNHIELVLRMHPVNKPPQDLKKLIQQSSTIRFDLGRDIYETIADYDCLITDYSSIYFDFLLSDKPIIFAPFDMETYLKKERELYFNYDEVTLRPSCMNWTQIIERLLEIKNNGVTDMYQTEYQELKLRFHNPPLNTDTPYSEALFKQLVEL
ncbi:CDP-glycerol glycerophosphotransferase family protein [Colwellia sp. PAMC 21821]|uniref:CDP-glycerol glycerophosphotransferase family protein n=1 Tax=Colwellia sp. PAMC 21821 TaxID=1816219 RepID=UPI0009BE7FA2|nr:CDP-glycerol glycerophosphotransferase family protein [Colwellia sp. PAMC 21821]ARD44559.1 hypothetical protein A3Q33_09705 [Colwellia sp. PAMC 21821]